MTFARLCSLATEEVAATLAELPPELRHHAERVPVLYHDRPSEAILAGQFEPDILGLFVGPPHGEDSGDRNDLPSQILLFLRNLWEFAAGDVDIFLDEVHLTYLHELGHYFGWDEQDLAERELD